MQLPDLSLFLVVIIFWATYLVLRKFLLSPLGAVWPSASSGPIPRARRRKRRWRGSERSPPTSTAA